MKLPSPRHDGATPAGHEMGMTAMKDTIMFFDHEGFGERNAIRSALAGDPPGGFDRDALVRLLRRAMRPTAPRREQARAA